MTHSLRDRKVNVSVSLSASTVVAIHEILDRPDHSSETNFSQLVDGLLKLYAAEQQQQGQPKDVEST